jgi:hypothetical protein
MAEVENWDAVAADEIDAVRPLSFGTSGTYHAALRGPPPRGTSADCNAIARLRWCWQVTPPA